MSDLADFVLGALHRAGGIVEAPAFDVYDVLLPDQVARRWGVPAFQRLTFAEAAGAGAEATPLGYGHPLVETLVEEVRAEPGCTQAFVNDLRTDKRGLLSLARQALALPNARLSEVSRQPEFVAACHLLRLNFKAALITDEKRERLVSVVMDVQAGFAVPDLAQVEGLARLEDAPGPDRHLPAPVRWLPGHAPLSRPVLDRLLERAVDAAELALKPELEPLRRRAARYLELDCARLNEYYTDITRDLERRRERAAGQMPDDRSESAAQRRTVLEEKLAAARAEWEAKLTDAKAKARLRVELELINLQVIHLPKVLLTVQIGNRTASVERTVVWDPLLHRIEPLACDVCGRAATRLMLCSGGHLAHEECLLAQQCTDCKRVYCRLCAGQVSSCVVCKAPVCLHSLNRCPQCGRSTCRAHRGLCHADAGQPARVTRGPAEPAEQQPPPQQVRPPPPVLEQERPALPQGKAGAKTTGPRPAPRPAPKAARGPTPSRIEVQIEPDQPVVTAFVLTQGFRTVAVRSWGWTEQGIEVVCRCEKGYGCPADGTLIEPADAAGIEVQMRAEIDGLRQEYGIPPRRVTYYSAVHGQARQVPRLTLQREWKTRRE